MKQQLSFFDSDSATKAVESASVPLHTDDVSSTNNSIAVNNDVVIIDKISESNPMASPLPSIDIQQEVAEVDNEVVAGEEELRVNDKVKMVINECEEGSPDYEDYIFLTENYRRIIGKTGEVKGISTTKRGTKLYLVQFNVNDKDFDEPKPFYRKELSWIG